MVHGVMRDIRPLPPGWQQHWSQERNQGYYAQMMTVPPKIVFQHPLDLPPASNPAPPPPPYPEPQPPSHYPGRAPSVSSMSSGVSSLSSPSISSPHNSAVMSGERVSTSAAGRPTRAQANVQAHGGVTKRNMTMPLNQMPRPQSHLQPVHANTLPGLPNGQKLVTPGFNAQMHANPMAKMPQQQPTGYTNQGGMYKLQYTGPTPGAPQRNPSMLSVSSSSTTMSSTSSIAPLKIKEKKEKKEKAKKPKDPNKRSLFGTSAMEDLREEHEVTMTAGTVATSTRAIGLPNMAMGGQVQMGVMNTMVPTQVPGFQQNMNLGMQSVVPLNAQMSMQMQQPPPQPGVDLGKFTNVAKNALSGALYLATGISTQDLVNLRSRLKVAFSGIPLSEIGIDARQLEAVLSGQPRASYQGVINALMIQQQREQILMLQTGRATSNVNYEDLIKQVRKMQGVANNKAQQTMAMNAGRQGIQIGGTMGVQGQATITQQNAMLQRQILMEQQKLAQMQMSMGQVPMMMNQQQHMGLQVQTTGVVNPMMQPGTVRRRRQNQQIAHTGTVKQEKKKKRDKPLPVAPEKKKKKAEQTQTMRKVAPSHVEGKKRDEVLLVEDQGGDSGGYVYEEVLLVEDQDQGGDDGGFDLSASFD